MCYVYKYVFNGEIIYIGKGKGNRLASHGNDSDNIDSVFRDEINAADIYFIEMANETMADVVESELIRRYKPKCNKAKTSDWAGLPFPEPAWTPFRIAREKKIQTKRDKEREEKKNKRYELEKAIEIDVRINQLKEMIESLEIQNKINETIIKKMQEKILILTGIKISYKFAPGDTVEIITEETEPNISEIHTETVIHDEAETNDYEAETNDSFSAFLKSLPQRINELY